MQIAAVTTARCYAAEGALPFAPVVAWLHALSGSPIRWPDLEPVWLAELGTCRPSCWSIAPTWPHLGS
ncbi:MAG TPA: hypothetical protein VM366_16435 [Anaerolineae bacterium]|nr:hypothetical protein [Anaerolineae bacterium]